ncbi:methyltransferase [Methanococcus voltae]|uniref:O-methyltransferase YrrM n=2 Tax=Methanococcus voltae TaxID=2188 RepID=A0ABT2EXZ8_METVO|nr:methyltransferase [Methanococcus voltae]MBP2173141.1 putative O-methyltransferase YrrM [Methanococcus voltae]MBP2202067.1 putative O-methyltransferase YrrM [Methanococcus voltae]MCS3922844.1 putative O-methyltransferase YrrM [Methanococcus voltae PS]
MAKNVLETPKVGPEQIENLFEDAYLGLRKFFLLKYCLQYNVFELLEKPKTFEEIAVWFEEQGFKPNNNLLESILDALIQFGLVKVYHTSYNSENVVYKSTEIAKTYLSPNSEFSKIDSLAPFFTYGERANRWINLEETLKSGELKTEEGSFFPDIIKRMAIDCRAGELKLTIDYLKHFEDIKNAKSILDVAGGHGLYGIALSYLNEDSKCKVFDLPEVCEETKKYIEEYGSDRVSTVAGNFFTDNFIDTLDDSNSEGYDLIFSSYNPGGKNPAVIDKICEATALNGIFANKQAFPENIGKKYATKKAFDGIDWNMFSFTGTKKEKVCYTFENSLTLDGYVSYLEEKGFEILGIFSVEDKKSLNSDKNHHHAVKKHHYSNIKTGNHIVVAKKIRE